MRVGECELEATSVVQSLETLAYYLKGCLRFNLWTHHSPLAQAMKKEVWEMTPRMQKFREAIQAFNVTISFVKGVHNHISDALLRSPVGGAEGGPGVCESADANHLHQLLPGGRPQVPPPHGPFFPKCSCTRGWASALTRSTLLCSQFWRESVYKM